VTSGTKSKPEQPGQKHTSTGEELHCKRCGEAMILATVLGEFGDKPRFKLFRCVACKFYDWVKA
jgi:DNA-directed RNA polymerase subunit M/transcription elongation factor TFIIS